MIWYFRYLRKKKGGNKKEKEKRTIIITAISHFICTKDLVWWTSFWRHGTCENWTTAREEWERSLKKLQPSNQGLERLSKRGGRVFFLRETYQVDEVMEYSVKQYFWQWYLEKFRGQNLKIWPVNLLWPQQPWRAYMKIPKEYLGTNQLLPLVLKNSFCFLYHF